MNHKNSQLFMQQQSDKTQHVSASDSQVFPDIRSRFRKYTMGQQQGLKKHIARQRGTLYQPVQGILHKLVGKEKGACLLTSAVGVLHKVSGPLSFAPIK